MNFTKTGKEKDTEILKTQNAVTATEVPSALTLSGNISAIITQPTTPVEIAKAKMYNKTLSNPKYLRVVLLKVNTTKPKANAITKEPESINLRLPTLSKMNKPIIVDIKLTRLIVIVLIIEPSS